jgi:FkbM family methyltransferase
MIKTTVRKLLRRLGYHVTKFPANNIDPVQKFLAAWAGKGRSPAFLIDIGANHGDWTRRALQCFPNAKILMVEPQERLRTYSQDLLATDKITWKTAGIADVIGEMPLAMPARDDSASFCIPPEKARAMGLPTVTVPVTTIDALVSEAGQIPDLIKIDAEGFDLKALKGASSILGKTEVILIECAICAGGMENSADNIFPLMWSKGYRLYDVTDLNYSPANGVLWLAEFVFVHESSPVWSNLKEY